MTYCLGIKVRDGLICLSDGRITAGTQVTNARKATLHGPVGAQFCIMTSGLRSLRDKTLAYLDRNLREAQTAGYRSVLDAVDGYCQQLRRVAEEDRPALTRSNLSFDLHAIIAGQMAEDPEPSMFLVYPEGNWVEIDRRTPYLAIGATAYGKPILDRALRFETSMATALKLAYLSFDSSRFSSADVGFPLDLVTFSSAERMWREAHYDYDDLIEPRTWWNEHITQLARDMPGGSWIDALLAPPGGGAHLTVVPDD